LGSGSRPRGGVNGNPVLAEDYFSLTERLVKSLVRSLASPFDYARVPSCEGTGSPPWVVIPLTVIQSRSRFGASLPILGFRVSAAFNFNVRYIVH
jgi:hypothetical protein